MPNSVSDRLNIGVADITFQPPGQTMPVYVGLTKDGTKFEYDPDFHEHTADQYGTTPIDFSLIGEKAKVTTQVLDTAKENMLTVLPTSTAEMSGGDIRALTFGQRPGLRLSDHAGRLTVHPVSAGAGHVDRDLILYQAVSKAKLDLAYKLDAEWVIPCEWVPLPDFTRPPGDMLFRIGPITDYIVPTKRVVSFFITPLQPKISTGDTVQFRANAIYEDTTSEDVTHKCNWVTSDDKVGTIAKPSGENHPAVATAVAEGTCIIRAEYIGYSNTTTLQVI